MVFPEQIIDKISGLLQSSTKNRLSANISAKNGITFFSFMRLYEKLTQSAYHGVMGLPKSSEKIDVYFKEGDLWASYQSNKLVVSSVARFNFHSADTVSVRGVPVDLSVSSRDPVVTRLHGKKPSLFRMCQSWVFRIENECEYTLRKVMQGKTKHEARYNNHVRYELELAHLGESHEIHQFMDHIRDVVGRFECHSRPVVLSSTENDTVTATG